jgi:hypothetical protein
MAAKKKPVAVVNRKRSKKQEQARLTLKSKMLQKAPSFWITDEESDSLLGDAPDFNKIPAYRRHFMERYVLEYLKDFNGKQAILRTGFLGTEEEATRKSRQLLQHPYVSWYMFNIMAQAEELAIISKNEMVFRLKQEACDPANKGGERVAALAKIAQVLGFDAPRKVELSGDLRTPGVMVLPLLEGETIEEWEAKSEKAQKRLKESVQA